MATTERVTLEQVRDQLLVTAKVMEQHLLCRPDLHVGMRVLRLAALFGLNDTAELSAMLVTLGDLIKTSTVPAVADACFSALEAIAAYVDQLIVDKAQETKGRDVVHGATHLLVEAQALLASMPLTTVAIGGNLKRKAAENLATEAAAWLEGSTPLIATMLGRHSIRVSTAQAEADSVVAQIEKLLKIVPSLCEAIRARDAKLERIDAAGNPDGMNAFAALSFIAEHFDTRYGEAQRAMAREARGDIAKALRDRIVLRARVDIMQSAITGAVDHLQKAIAVANSPYANSPCGPGDIREHIVSARDLLNDAGVAQP